MHNQPVRKTMLTTSLFDWPDEAVERMPQNEGSPEPVGAQHAGARLPFQQLLAIGQMDQRTTLEPSQIAMTVS